jgi:hypothetical protein
VVRYTFFLTCCAVFANHFDFSHAAVWQLFNVGS